MVDLSRGPDAGVTRTDALGQPIGFAVAGWSARPRPARTVMTGRRCRVEPLDVELHAADLHAANSLDASGGIFRQAFVRWLDAANFNAAGRQLVSLSELMA